MLTTIRDLIPIQPVFSFWLVNSDSRCRFVILSAFSPYEEDRLRRKVKRNLPPSADFVFGTTSQGQDVFWSLTFAIRNTLIISGIAVFIGRGIGVTLGMIPAIWAGFSTARRNPSLRASSSCRDYLCSY